MEKKYTGQSTISFCSSTFMVVWIFCLSENDNHYITDPYNFLPTWSSLLAGCMLCFGHSAFFRFNHPEEALRMKSMLPGGSQGLSTTKTLPKGKNPSLIFIQYDKAASKSRLNNSCDPEISWSLTTVCMKVAQFPQQLFWAEQMLWADSQTKCYNHFGFFLPSCKN